MSSNALEKSLRTLEAFKSDFITLTIKELSILTGDSLSSVQRSVYTLEALGYLEREEDGNRYVLGRSCLRPAYGYLRNDKFLELSSPHLIELSNKLNLASYLIILDGTEIIYLARFPSKDQAFVLTPIGRRWPAVNAASGRAILSALPETKCEEIIESSILKKVTTKSITNKTKIRELINEARNNQYVAHQFEELRLGVASISAAVTSLDGSVLGAVLIGGEVSRFQNLKALEQMSNSVYQTALTIKSYNIKGRIHT